MSDGELVGRTKKGDVLSLDDLAQLQPGLGRLMPEVSRRYWYLYYAAKGGNWRLARYQLNQIRAVFRVGAATRPHMAKYLDAFDKGYLGPVGEAIEACDGQTFEEAYRRGIAGANRFHRETNHPEVVWKLPPDPPTDLELGSVEEGD